MLSKTATYWLAGIGVIGVAAISPVILKYYHVWPGAADTPAPLLSPNATNSSPAAPPSTVSAPAPAPAAAKSTPTPVRSAAEPAHGETPPAPATPDSAAPSAVASNQPAQSQQQAPAPSALAPAATPAPAPSASPPAADSAPASQPKADPQRPAFDVVRVEPTGDAVIAGRASPRAAVQLRSDGQVVAQVDADDSGQFAILPPPFSAGGHRLQLAARSGGASETLSDAIGIEVPATAEAAAPNPAPAPVSPPSASPPVTAKPAAPPPKPVKTARSETPASLKVAPPPGAPKAAAPDMLKAAPTAATKVAAVGAASASPTPAPVVSILSVETDGAGRFEAKGAAEPNAVIRLYLNNTYVAEAVAGADGRWSLTVERGMTPGGYTIRADEIDRANGSVVARAEAPFNYPDRPTSAQIAAATPAKAIAPEPEKAPAKPAPNQAAPSSTATAPAGQPAPVAVTATTPASQAASPPQTAEPVEAPKASASTPPAPATIATAPEQPKADETNIPSKSASEPTQSSSPSKAAASPPAAGSTSAPPATSMSAPAATEAPAVALAEPAKPTDGANPVIPDLRTTKVVRGDNLWNLSKHFYGDGPEYTIIYEANSSQIRNPRLIYPDQIFVVPRKPPE